MAKVFISYRREDSAETCGRIYDRLEASFGRQSVFKDVDNIPPGVDFRAYLQDALRLCDVVLVVIGPRWLGSETPTGEQRLFLPNDFVRIEVEVALQLNKPLIPVLVNNAQAPAEAALPPSIGRIAYRNAINVRPDPDFRRDMDHLVASLSGYGAPAQQYATPATPGASQPQVYHPAMPAGYYPQSYAPTAPGLGLGAQITVRLITGVLGAASAFAIIASLIIGAESGPSVFSLDVLPTIAIGLDILGTLIGMGVAVSVKRGAWVGYLVIMNFIPFGLAPIVYAFSGPVSPAVPALRG